LGRNGNRRKLAKNIYADDRGISIVVQVNKLQREYRFDAGTDLETLIKNRDQLRGELHDEAPTLERGTLTHDALKYLKQITGRPGSAAERSHVYAWIDRLGPKHRSRITAADVRTVLAEWRESGTWRGGRGKRERKALGKPASEKTLKERLRVLKRLYKTLDGPKSRTPCDDVERPQPPSPTPVGVPAATIRAVARRLKARAAGTRRTSKERKDYARFLMLAATGQRPAQVGRARREDFKRSFWIVRGAKGGPSHAIHLNRDMRAAVRAFVSAEAYGPIDTSNFAKLLRANGWPKGIEPYHARHSVAIDAIERGADIGDLQAILGHKSIETTRRFYGPILALRQKAFGKKLEGRMKVG
jgi:integrase